MTTVGLLGIFLGLFAVPFATIERTRTRITVLLCAWLFHIGTAVLYYFYVQTADADTTLYYYDRYNMYSMAVKPGTLFVIHFVQALKEAIGGSYLDYFLVFQSFGFWGICALMRTVEELHLELQVQQPRLTYVMLFLPGIFFWTSAIGKDAPLFLGCSLVIWAAMSIRRRLPVFSLGILIMALIRPHIAMAALVALAVTVFFDRRSHLLAKALLLVFVLAGTYYVAGSMETGLNVNVASAESVGEFFARQSTMAQRTGGTTTVEASFPIGLFSLLCRPFFIDAQGIFGLIASVENIFILLMLGTIARRFGQSVKLAGAVFFMRYAITFALVIMLLLAMVYYNVGLGLRQKMMFMPGLIAFYAGMTALRIRQRVEAAILLKSEPQVRAPYPA